MMSQLWQVRDFGSLNRGHIIDAGCHTSCMFGISPERFGGTLQQSRRGHVQLRDESRYGLELVRKWDNHGIPQASLAATLAGVRGARRDALGPCRPPW